MHFNLRLIPLLPFLGAGLLMLFGRKWKRETVHVVSAGSVFASCLVVFDAFFARLPQAAEVGGLTDVVWSWFSAGNLNVELALRMDGLSGLLCLIITFIGFLIHVYAQGYMADDPDYARFFAYLNLFCGAMLVLVLGDSLPVMFVGWEGVGLCSYLLIGFWYRDNANADAGKKAFIVNRIGDFGFLLGMFLVFSYAGTLNFTEVTSAASPGGSLFEVLKTEPLWGATPAFWIGLLLFIGAAGKSAQIPLYTWLPDAMAGPTPVSALIHAATMVTAGVYMVARMHAVYKLSSGAMAIVAAVGALTALYAAIIGFAQNDFKKVLAYSTISQLGFMFAGVGSSNFDGGIFHLFTHAFFKAGLFLCAGSVMHAMGGSGDITIMGGLRKKLPWTHGVFWVCWLAICGVFPLSGFFSKDSIVAGDFSTKAFGPDFPWLGPAIGAVLLVAALGTAFYMSRLYYLVFSGTETRASDEIKHHIHESPGVMVAPLVVLAVGAALSGFIGLPGGLLHHADWNLLAHELDPVVGPEMAVDHTVEGWVFGASMAAAILGILLARAFYRGGYREPARKFAATFPGLVRLVENKFYVDEIYDRVFVRPLKKFSRFLYTVVDRYIVDRFMVGVLPWAVDMASRFARNLQGGDGQRYIAVFAVGVAVLVYCTIHPMFVLPGELKIARNGLTVEVDARRGSRPPVQPLEYSFDFDSDGKPEVTTNQPQASHVYDRPGTYNVTVKVRDPRWNTDAKTSTEVEVR